VGRKVEGTSSGVWGLRLDRVLMPKVPSYSILVEVEGLGGGT